MQNSAEIKGTNEFPIVGIGASAGGLDPIRKLLEMLPVDTGMAFVVIQHLATGQESMLPEILSRSTKMKVLQVTDGIKVEKNQVYVITPGTTMTLENGYLKLVPKGGALKPINDFLISLASERKVQAIGIVLSGTGNDGTEGLKAIKAEGGITFAQDPETAQYADMPRNAIAAETADFILIPEDIVKEIVRIANNPHLTRGETATSEPSRTETSLRKILIMLKTAFGVDFSHYKETTINRRMARRMVINKIENEKEYVAFLRANPNELNALFDDLLIGVTSFFREPDTFVALKENVFPELIKNRSPNESIRVWVPGCSTGEEVYSLAIAIQEFLEKKAITNLRVQIFGTDANEKNIDKARQGVYPKTIEDKVSDNRLKRFFNRQNGNYQITKLIREMCIFAKQDITSDPPFSNLDVIVCRNVLIYFDNLLHERVFSIFHYGLKDSRFLVIGESESIGKFNYLFEPVTAKGLIFRKKRTQPQAFLHPETFIPYSFTKKIAKQPEKPNSMVLLKEEVDRLLISEYVPATLLVNNNLEVLVFRGQVDPYLTHESGIASFNLTKLIRKELRTDVQTLIYRARKENKDLKETVQFRNDRQQKTVTIKVKPLKTVDYEEPFFLITFEEKDSANKHSHQIGESIITSIEKESAEYRQIQELKEDLESTKQSLQTIIEVQEATNEELRSTMEEAQSSNEELQSTNEELETAKEELQSGNEELQTLNEELKNRNQALGRLNDDLANLQTNIDASVIIVDCDLKIRRFTVSAQELLRISPSHVGHPITDIDLAINISELEKVIKAVITNLSPVNREVTCTEGTLCEMRVRPYLTEEKKIDGAILTFTDITERKKADERIRRQINIQDGTNRIFQEALSITEEALGKVCLSVAEEVTQSKFGFIGEINEQGFEDIAISNPGWDACQAITPGGHGKQNGNFKIHGIYGKVISEGQGLFTNDPINYPDHVGLPLGHPPLKSFLGVPLKSDNKTIGIVAVGNREGGYGQEELKVLEALAPVIVEVLLRKKAEEKLEEYQRNLEKLVVERTKKLEIASLYARSLLEASLDPMVTISKGGKITDVNKATEDVTGCSRQELIGSDFSNYFTDPEKARASYQHVFTEGLVRDYPLAIRHKSGRITTILYNASIYRNSKGEVQGVFAAARDITELKKAEEEAHESSKKLKDSERLAAIGATAGMVGHDIRNPLQAITGDIYLAITDLAAIPESEEKKNILESLGEVEKNVSYINKIVADLQDFARPLTPKIEETDISKTTQEVLATLCIPENITVTCSVEEGFPLLLVDATFIQRILTNLCNNALQAMPNGGKLVVAAAVKDGKATLTIQDTGDGIPESIKSKIFTPLITSKAKGQGFGLSVVKRFTEAMGGTVRFESEVGKGTSFILELPVKA